MLEEDKFIENVWNKYEMQVNRRKKEQFYTTSLYKNTDFTKTLRTAAMFVFTLAITVSIIGGVYAGVKKYSGVVQKEGKKNPETANSFRLYNEMEYVKEDRIYYKVVTNIDDYSKYTSVWSNMPDMTKSDFEDYFIVILAVENIDRTGIYISDARVEDDTLCIDVKRDGDKEDRNTAVFGKIEKEKYRENVKINLLHVQPEMPGYTPMDDLPEDYSIEQAMEDGCVVIKNNRIISENKNALKEYFEKTENGENCSIRILIVYIDENGEKLSYNIEDIEHREGKYIWCCDASRIDMNEEEKRKTRSYMIGEKFEFHEFKSKKDPNFHIEDYTIINEKDHTQTFIIVKVN